MGNDSRTLHDLLSLDGKVAIVTGGAGYLGRAMCEALAECGATVVVASRNLERCREVAEQLGPGHLALPLDASSEESIRTLVAETISQAGRVDVLVNSAYRGPTPRIPEATVDDFAGSLNLGVTSYFLAARECWQFMREHGGGSIVNIASMYGMVGSYPEAYEGTKGCSPPNYHAVKGAVLQLTRHLAVYWAKDGVRVNAISPGPFPHPQTEQDLPDMVARLKQKCPMGRMGLPWELKGAIALLASDAGSYITGHNLVVDGGWTAW